MNIMKAHDDQIKMRNIKQVNTRFRWGFKLFYILNRFHMKIKWIPILCPRMTEPVYCSINMCANTCISFFFLENGCLLENLQESDQIILQILLQRF